MNYNTRHTLASLGIKLTLVGWLLYIVIQFSQTGVFHPEWLLVYLLTFVLFYRKRG